MSKVSTWVLCTALRQGNNLFSAYRSSHHPPRRHVFSSLQQPFLIWPALGWHIPEPKCTHYKLLSLVVKLFTPESVPYQGRLGILNWITLTRKNSCSILFQHHLTSEMLVSTPFCPQSLLLPSCFLEVGHQPAPILTLHSANIGSCSWRQNIIIHKADHV